MIIRYRSHPQAPLQQDVLSDLLAEVDSSLPEPLRQRSYFSSFGEVAAKFLRDCFIAYATDEAGKAVGVAVVHAEPGRYSRGCETYVGVIPSHRHRGIGKKLSVMVIELCRSAGMLGIMTTCDPRNVGKISLNLSLGYMPVRDVKELARFEKLNPKWVGKAFFTKDW